MVSIIVPVFNSEKFLSRCVKSLTCQILDEIEIILINDASTDNSLKIIRDFEKKFPNKIRVINSNVNLKQGGARNLGIKAAKGEYLGFVDSDDWVEPNMFSALYKKAKKEDSDMIGCKYFYAFSDKNFYAVSNRYSKNLEKISNINLNDKQKECLLFMISGLWCHLYKRSIILQNNIFFIENITYEDNHFVRLYSLYINKYSFVNKPLYFYFKNLNSTTNLRNKFYHLDRLLIEKEKIKDYQLRAIFNRYRDGIEIDFVKTFYVNTVILLFAIFDDPPFKKISDLKLELCKNFPEYKKNPYYDIVISNADKLKIFLAENFPHVLKLCYKFKQFMSKF
ncbi:MAG: glycosyltransferase [Oscillospiraceae bacterium]|jgi:glycosyltransferase involved in cell wall biosynthesis|nr:glycosyltransferase [Oscillospiraceae bacterium]